MKCLGKDLSVLCTEISRVNKISHVNKIPNLSGVSETITGLVFMMIDLHLRVPHLCRKLI